MITKVEIENFQSHKHTVLEFTPETNVIIGKSDTGKSSVFRAINWVLSNRPLGDAYCSEWGGDTQVAIHTQEGHTIKRLRTPSRNEYVLNGEVFAGFGTEVPDAISAALRMDEYNVQAQMDPPFLLAMTPGEAARALNQAASIDDIDHTVSGLRRSYRQIDNQLQHDEEQLSEYEKQMEQYADLPKLEELMEKAEQLEEERWRRSQALDSLQRYTNRAELLRDQLEETKHVPELLEQRQEVADSHSSFQTKAADHRRKSQLVRRAKELQDRLRSTEYVVEADPILKQVENDVSTAVDAKRRITALKKARRKAERLSGRLAASEERMEKIEQEYHDIAPELCPLCGSEMKEGGG